MDRLSARLRDLKNAFEAGRLRFSGHLAGLADASVFNACLAKLRRIDWVVYETQTLTIDAHRPEEIVDRQQCAGLQL